MPDALVKNLEALNDDNFPNLLKNYSAVYKGGKAFRDRITEFMVPNPNEPAENHRNRVDKSYYTNYTGPILDFLVSYTLSDPPTVEGMGELGKQFLPNVDRAGTGFTDFWSQALLDCLVYQRSWVMVKLPDSNGEVYADAQAEREAGARNAYLSRIDPESVRDWALNEDGKLKWVLFKTIVSERDNPPEPRTYAHVWTLVTNTEIVRWEWVPLNNQNEPSLTDYARETARVQHGYGQIPIILTKVPYGLWAMSKLYETGIASFRRDNALSWALDRSAFAMPVIKREWTMQNLTLGAGYYIPLGPDDDISWFEPNGSSYEALANNARRLVEELYRLVQLMALSAHNDATRSRMSGESKKQDFHGLHVILTRYAEIIRKSMVSALSMITNVYDSSPSDDNKITVSGMVSWSKDDLMVFIEKALLSKNWVKSETFKKVVAKQIADRMLKSEVSTDDLSQINKELDSADWSDEPLLQTGDVVDDGE